MKGREEEARLVLERLDQERDVEGVIGAIRDEVAIEGLLKGSEGVRNGLNELFSVPGHRRALTIACMLQALQQLCGFNSLMYFSATIFSLVGFNNPITTSLSVAVTNFIFTLFAFKLIDRIGRRRILLLSIPFMCFGLILCSICFIYINPGRTGLSTRAIVTTLLGRRIGSSSPSLFALALLASLILYVSAYALGLGCVPWQQSELFPLSVRSLGSGLATTTNWASNFIVGISFLPALDIVGPSATFAVYAIVCAVGWILVLRIYPETMGLSLEEVGDLLKDGWGVKGRNRGDERGEWQRVESNEEQDDSVE